MLEKIKKADINKDGLLDNKDIILSEELNKELSGGQKTIKGFDISDKLNMFENAFNNILIEENNSGKKINNKAHHYLNKIDEIPEN